MFELRVSEADFRIQQNMINDLFNISEEVLGKSITQKQPDSSWFTTNHAEQALDTSKPVKECAEIFKPQNMARETSPPDQGLTRNETQCEHSKKSGTHLQIPPARRSTLPVPSGPLAATNSQPRPETSAAPKATPKLPPRAQLSDIEQKARANALRRSQNKRPVCWLFKTGLVF